MEEVKVLEWYVFEENVIPLFVSQYFEEPFLGMVKTTLGSRYTAQIEVIVGRALKTFLTLCYFNLNWSVWDLHQIKSKTMTHPSNKIILIEYF